MTGGGRGAPGARMLAGPAAREWLGREDSNLRMRDPKSRALPLGHAPPTERDFRHGPLALERSGVMAMWPQRTAEWRKAAAEYRRVDRVSTNAGPPMLPREAEAAPPAGA